MLLSRFCLNFVAKKTSLVPRIGNNIRKQCFHVSAFRRNEDEQFIIHSRYPDVPLSKLAFFDYIWENRKKHGHRTALVDGVTDRSLSYKDAFRQSSNFGKALRECGAVKGDVLAMFLPNCIEFPLVFAGAASAGVAVTTMNPIYTAKEISRQLAMSKAKFAVTNNDLLPVLKEAIQLLDGKQDWQGKVFIADKQGDLAGYIDLKGMLEIDLEEKDPVQIDVYNDLCALPYSSGTTGLPKGVMLSHFNLVANACQEVLGPEEITVCDEARGAYQPVTLCVLPLYHIYALNVTMTSTLWCGGKLVMLPKFDPQTFISALERYRPSFLHLAPPLLAFCADHEDVTPKLLEPLHHIMTAAAPTGPALLRRFKKKAPSVIVKEGWGMSETSPLGLLLPLDDIVEGSCGVVVPNTQCKVVDVSSGKNLPPNKTGELCLRGPQVMKGYLDNEKATVDTIKNGWLHSGDIAYYNKEGHIFIVDRLKELIKVKGFQVPPAELEDLLRTFPGVADVAVIGIPHERFGEAPRAYVVQRPDANLTEKAVMHYVAENTAPYKHLIGGVEFIDAIPKSNSGKILRKDLKTSFTD